jgi:WD repeat-containing protein 23
MGSGDFGRRDIELTSLIRHQKKLATRLLNRELGMYGPRRQNTHRDLLRQQLIPGTPADTIINYEAPVYSGQFSDDGNFFYSCVKDFNVRMYDTSNPYDWKYYKTVFYPFGHWTLTDASLSPDNKWLAYTSISPEVCLAPTDPNDTGDPYDLDLSDDGRQGRRRHHAFGIWSIRFSGDGRELVAGTNDRSIVVYDIEARRSVLEIKGHDDVNAVCFADKNSPHILYSGSDDTIIKVWDRRSMGDSREAGAFVGHTEGITYIDSKGDGRYCLSNGKDQSMKLWDLRKMMTTEGFAAIDPMEYSTQFDYRWGTYDEDDWAPHPHDNSVVTFRGHKVLRTLIRCHFSPPGSTNSRYVYSGSEDGKVYIWNMDATLAGKVDVLAANHGVEASERAELDGDEDEESPWRACVRDASWHPNVPMIAGTFDLPLTPRQDVC